MEASQSFELGRQVCTMTPDRLVVGQQTYLWQDIVAGGLSYTKNGRSRSAPYIYCVHLARRDGSTGKLKEIVVQIDSPDDPVVRAFQSRFKGQWLGTLGYFQMRKALGLSNTVLYAIVAGAILLALGLTAFLLLGAASHPR